jgi:hypothetical protein
MEYVSDGKDRVVLMSPEGSSVRYYKTPLIFKKAIESFAGLENKTAEEDAERRKKEEEREGTGKEKKAGEGDYVDVDYDVKGEGDEKG